MHLLSVRNAGYLFAPALPPDAYAAMLSGKLDTLTALPPIEA